MMIFDGVVTVLTVFFLPETFAPVLLQKKVRTSKHMFAFFLN
jgi:hypothetical protein